MFCYVIEDNICLFENIVCSFNLDFIVFVRNLLLSCWSVYLTTTVKVLLEFYIFPGKAVNKITLHLMSRKTFIRCMHAKF